MNEGVPVTVPLPVLLLLRVPVIDGVSGGVPLTEGGTDDVAVKDKPPDTVAVTEGVPEDEEVRVRDCEAVDEGVASTTPCTVMP